MSGLNAVVLALGDDPFTSEIAEALGRADWAVASSMPHEDEIDGLAIVLPPPVLRTAFLDISDDQLAASVDGFLDLFDALRDGLPRVHEGGAVVVVSDRGHLGGWHGAHEMAFSGAVAGLMRSVALENAPRRIRANLIAAEFPDAKTPSDPAAVAKLAAFLLSTDAAAVNGELILANAGHSLQIREARDQRPRPGPAPANPS